MKSFNKLFKSNKPFRRLGESCLCAMAHQDSEPTLLDSSSENDNSLFYLAEWLDSIAKMSPSQCYETFRMNLRCFEKLVHKIGSKNALITNLKVKVSVFVFYISHVSTYRKLRKILVFRIQHYIGLLQK
ncbi:hypothetical protein ENBRE01_1686 [Enteropsectra breve]|nr:hypothetical protein ENBRE01_1686 [Enteropsectra breve]